jgi:tRNA(fMet)-specific endonuclease VapC
MSPGYLLDTDWIIDHFHRIEPVTRKVGEMSSAGVAISIISLAELYEGVHYSRDPSQSEAVLQRFLAAVSVLPVDEDICKIFGRERGKLRQRHTIVGDFDLLIASTCLRYGLPVCTNNRRHFELVEGLQIISA